MSFLKKLASKAYQATFQWAHQTIVMLKAAKEAP
jgi:hypothetical protein